MNKKQIKIIEDEIELLLSVYDMAMKENNKEMISKTTQCIEYELDKLDKNEIKLETKSYNH